MDSMINSRVGLSIVFKNDRKKWRIVVNSLNDCQKKKNKKPTGCFSTTDIFDLLIFQLKRPDNLAIKILLVKLDWEIYILSKIAIHMNFSKLV